LSLVRDRRLSALLAEAIEQVTDDHRDTCDVANPISPSATVAILRLSDGLIEHLVLGDSFVVLDRADGAPLVVSDPREVIISRSYQSAIEAAAEGSDEYHRVLRALRANRNRPGGFWVAKDDPRAADEAITGSCPISELTGAVLLSNGASRIVDRFRLADWPGVMAVLASSGPAEIIHRVRQAEVRHAVDRLVAHIHSSARSDCALPTSRSLPTPQPSTHRYSFHSGQWRLALRAIMFSAVVCAVACILALARPGNWVFTQPSHRGTARQRHRH
jgi:hypothetical protein